MVRAMAVENEFRQLLGIQHREDNGELPPQVDDDLMWIPTPEAIGFFGESEKFQALGNLSIATQTLVGTLGKRRLNENPSRYLERGLHIEKSLSSCHLNKQCLINGLEAEVHERCL